MTPTPAASEQQPDERFRLCVGHTDTHVLFVRGSHDAIKALQDQLSALSRLRDEVIEECAKLCEEKFSDPAWNGLYRGAAAGCAHAIRSLHAQPQDEQKP